MEGRRLIVMMVVGGMTQYMATVQGMPADIEERRTTCKKFPVGGKRAGKS
jgi:hypothetical protein